MNNCLITKNSPAGAGNGSQQGQDPESAATYLADESRMRGCSEKIFFPQSEGDVIALLRAAKTDKKTITVSGGRTGITDGAVPNGDWLMSMECMGRILDNFTL